MTHKTVLETEWMGVDMGEYSKLTVTWKHQGHQYIFHDVEQNSDEWYQLRSGKLTSSSLGYIMANYPKAFGQPAQKTAYKIIAEQLTGEAESSGFTNEHMQRGHDQEPLARMHYEETNFVTVKNGGFFENGQGVGCSPDGLVDNDGLIEIKSVIPSTHIINIKRQAIDPAYKWQIYGNLKLTGREWIDFISYCPLFPEHMRMFKVRVYRDAPETQEYFSMIDDRVSQFFDFLEEQKELVFSLGLDIK